MKCIPYVILLSLVCIACATVPPTEIATSTPVTPKETATPKVAPIKFKGQVSRGQTFEKEIFEELVFRLDPFAQGWEIWIGDKSGTGHNFSGVATPPFHGMNARYIEGWHFRNSDNSGANEVGEKNVNAPQHERRFCFFLNEADYQVAYYWLNDQLLSSDKERQEIREKYNSIQSRTGILQINRLELGNLIVNEQAWIEYTEFDVELNSSACEM